MSDIEDTINFVQETFGSDYFIPLRQANVSGREEEYVVYTINSTFVSSVVRLPMFESCYRYGQVNAQYREARTVNIPSSAK